MPRKQPGPTVKDPKTQESKPLEPYTPPNSTASLPEEKESDSK